MTDRLSLAVALAACAAAAGCDFDAEVLACARAELCTIDGSKPTLRFPHNGVGLGNANANLPLAWTPVRPYLAWDYDGGNNWVFRVQLNRCAPGEAFDQCPFVTTVSDQTASHALPDVPGTTLGLPYDLQIGSRYVWRVRACDSSRPGTPCGPWSDPRYFDVGRPEAIPNDFSGAGRGALAIGQLTAANASQSELVYLYQGINAGPVLWKSLPVGPPTGISLNYWAVVAGVGDLNGDGYSDLAVGYRPSFTGVPQPTPVDVWFGSSSGMVNPQKLGPYDGNFGAVVGRAGDINGDGYSDLVVCQDLQQRAVVYFGSGTGLNDSPSGDAQLELPAALLDQPFCSFAALLDVDADGYDDIAVAGEGQVRVFHGRGAGGTWDAVNVPIPPGATAFGASMAGGDFNGDGHGDLVVTGGNGKAYLYLGNPQWFSAGAVPPPIAFDIPAGTVASAGDLDDDGYADLVVGAGSTGLVEAFFGSATGPPRAGIVPQDQGLPGFGVAFAGLGDVTDDYYDDIGIGSTNGFVVYRGTSSEADVARDSNAIIPPTGSSQFGIDVASGF